jgi:hypothetical protein
VITAADAPVVDPHLIGLARVSTDGQDTQPQRDVLTQAGCARIFEETISTRSQECPGLAAALDHLRPHAGDSLVVWKLDRLGRSVKDVLTIADDLYERGIALRVLTGTLAGVYTPTGEGKFFFTVMAAFAELERDLIQLRPCSPTGHPPTGDQQFGGVGQLPKRRANMRTRTSSSFAIEQIQVVTR